MNLAGVQTRDRPSNSQAQSDAADMTFLLTALEFLEQGFRIAAPEPRAVNPPPSRLRNPTAPAPR